MSRVKAVALIALATALAIGGAGWKWRPGGHGGSGAPVSHLAGWTWVNDPNQQNPPGGRA